MLDLDSKPVENVLSREKYTYSDYELAAKKYKEVLGIPHIRWATKGFFLKYYLVVVEELLYIYIDIWLNKDKSVWLFEL